MTEKVEMQQNADATTPRKLVEQLNLEVAEKSEQIHGSERKIQTELKIESTIKLVISKPTNLDETVTTETTNVADLEWRLAAWLSSGDEDDDEADEWIAVGVVCNEKSESTLWSCDADIRFKLVAQQEKTPSVFQFCSKKFNFYNRWCYVTHLLDRTVFVDPLNGYIKDNQAIIEAHIVIKNTTGIRHSPPSIDFLIPECHFADGVLLIGDVRLNICKKYLSLYSPVFGALFFGDFRERNMHEIRLDGVVATEFIELLHVVYPTHKKIDADNVEYLLELADRYEIAFVTDACEKFLIETKETPLINKLSLADRHRLSALQDVCLRSLTDSKSIKDLSNTDGYEHLGETTKVALLEKLLKMREKD